MKKLLPLLSVLFLISCSQEDIQQPVGSDFEVLNIERNQTDVIIYYNLDILYTGKVDSESLIKKVKEIKLFNKWYEKIIKHYVKPSLIYHKFLRD